MGEVGKLLGADQTFFALPLDGSVHVVGIGERTDDAAVQYERDYWQTDFVISERRKALGLEVHHQDQLYLKDEIHDDVLYNEWCVPNKLFDTLGMAVDVSDGPIPAGINVYHDRLSSRFGDRGRVLMELLAPAFKASVRSYSLLVQLSRSVHELIDVIPTGVCVFDAVGGLLHENKAMDSLYHAEPERDRLRSTVMRVGRRVVGTNRDVDSPSSEIVETRTNRYDVRLSHCSAFPSLAEAAAMVIVESSYSDEMKRRHASLALRQRYQLTKRETEVALLLARRLATSEIARALGVSAHTVRHHIESIFSKTGVTRRANVAKLFDP